MLVNTTGSATVELVIVSVSTCQYSSNSVKPEFVDNCNSVADIFLTYTSIPLIAVKSPSNTDGTTFSPSKNSCGCAKVKVIGCENAVFGFGAA